MTETFDDIVVSGGGSFDGGTSQLLVSGENSGNGFSVITRLPPSPTPVPEPASLALLGTGVAGLLSFGLVTGWRRPRG